MLLLVAVLIALVVVILSALHELEGDTVLVTKGGIAIMPLSLAVLLLVLALVFLVVSVVRPFPLWPTVLCLILERAIAVGWR